MWLKSSDVPVLTDRKLCIAIAALMLLSGIVYGVAYVAHPEIKVGIVMVDDIDPYFEDVIADGFLVYDDYFDAKVLPYRFNASEVQIKDELYLNSDFFKLGEPEDLREKYDVDLILFVTDHRISNWDEDGRGRWGQADTESGSAVMTITVFKTATEDDDKKLQAIAVHEVFHLLGYRHNKQDDSGVMQYGLFSGNSKLAPYFEFQLPLRACVYKLGIGYEPKIAYAIDGFLVSLALAPMLVAMDLMVMLAYSKIEEQGANGIDAEGRDDKRSEKRGDKKEKKGKYHPLVITLASAIVGAALVTFYVYSFLYLLSPILFMVFFHHMYYLFEGEGLTAFR